MKDLLRVGVIANTHGVRGEVKVFPTTDDANRYKKLKKVILDTGKEQIDLEIQSVKFFKQFVIVKFKDIDNINDIEKYKGMELFVTRENAVKLAPNENFICDLVGCNVIVDTDKSVLGIIKDVLITGANDVYVVEDGKGNEILLPVTKECVLDVNVDNKEVLVHLLPGLLDIYIEKE
ncbi:MAG: ribosome maturation factor RimM [Lachnospiraceae bacterium]|nr:ribosome maturation factor RimM [Lachnospiraceae bacterium]